jgi:threonine/homoserine/homoserine lactone efflux protein
LLGLTLALSSPWNIAFWLAVIGQQDTLTPAASIAFAACVLAGALTWGLVLCIALRLGARFATPAWEVATQALTGLLMLGFAVRLALRVGGGAGF